MRKTIKLLTIVLLLFFLVSPLPSATGSHINIPPNDIRYAENEYALNIFDTQEYVAMARVRQGQTAELDFDKPFDFWLDGPASPPEVSCDFVYYGGDFFFLPDGASETRQPRYLQDDDFQWEEGIYEVDIFVSCVMLVFKDSAPSSSRIFAWLTPPIAQADEYWGEYVGTLRFTVINKNASPECCSSVLFLPGIMSSRLYENETRRWEPSGDGDIQALYLDEQGKSLNEDIAATEVVDEFRLIGTRLDLNVYKSFLSDLSEMKQGGIIADYIAFPYDWRLSIPDILADGSLEAEARRLASESITGKVAIVAHSNGGLLAKALVNNLGSEAANIVDQIILVGVPQIGTPQAVGALLHGYDTGIPYSWLDFVLSEERARDFARNAPMSYHLLPHQDYYDSAGASISTPLIAFEPGEATQPFIDYYGQELETADELYQFIIGQEGRTTPAYDDLKSPAIGNRTLRDSAVSYLSGIGSDWQPPEGIAVRQIAGIGEDTLSGITYKTVKECVLRLPPAVSTVPICLKYEPRFSYAPNEVIDGDGTVVVPSALAMSDAGDSVERWWVNLAQHNAFGQFRKNRDHKNLLEIDELRAFIFNHLLAETPPTDLPRFISNSAPLIRDPRRLRFILHSPLALSATDTDGNEVGETTSDIPGASYRRYGEVQVINVFTNDPITIFLDGESEGSFTLEVAQYEDGNQVALTTFSAIPSTADTKAAIEFSDGTIQNAGDLVIDYDGDGADDISLAPEDGAVITTPPPSLTELITFLKTKIQSLSIKEKLKTNLLKKIDNLEKKIVKKEEKNKKVLEKLGKKVHKQSAKGRIASATADELLALIDELEAMADTVPLDTDLLQELKDAINSLNAKKNIKNDLLRRVERLEDRRKLVGLLSNLAAGIIRKSEKEKIPEADARELVTLLEKIEELL